MRAAAHNITAAAPTPSATATGGVGMQRWNSPIPYLFSGLALMLGLVAFALLLLACAYRHSSSAGESSSNGPEEKSTKAVDRVLQPEMEPRIVVIMAGETIPSYLAKPTAAASTSHIEEV